MIPLKITEYQSDDLMTDWEKICSATDQDSSAFEFDLFRPFKGLLNVSTTSRDWLGILNQSERKFRLITAQPRCLANFLGLQVHGRFISNTSIIKVVIRLELTATYFFVGFLFFLILGIVGLVGGNIDEALSIMIIPSLYFSLIAVNVIRLDREFTRLMEL